MPAGSTSIESSSSCSGSYYREAESNIIQTINLTLLPVNNVQQANRPTALHPQFPSASPATSKPIQITGTQCKLSGRKSFRLSSPLVAPLNCGKKHLLCCKTRHALKVSRNALVRSTHVVAMSHMGC
ncbi:unnamed protein product [Orchesella dallaii]|uniref:Uncharacterized protein n=1 Tax=Orchesella dallaii TaxID=48710 RepID=A0ABP1PQK8_9HEXA